jgi:hypothetical protein
MEWVKTMLRRIECKVAPWVARQDEARRDAIASAHERAFIQSHRPLVSRIVFELGVHERENHIVDMIHDVVRGSRK